MELTHSGSERGGFVGTAANQPDARCKSSSVFCSWIGTELDRVRRPVPYALVVLAYNQIDRRGSRSTQTVSTSARRRKGWRFLLTVAGPVTLGARRYIHV